MTLGALFATVMALGLFVWLKPPKTQTSHALSSIKSGDARTLRVLRDGKPLAALEKRDAAWFVTAPMSAPADTFQVLRLLAILDAKSALRYPPSESAKFELGTPQTEIIINDQRFAFGAVNTVTREQYVLTQNQIYPLELRYGAAVPANAHALLRRSVLAPGDAPLRFDFGTFTVENDGKKWIATAAPDDLSQDDFNRWVAQWREGDALRSEPADQQKSLSEIHITLKQNQGAADTRVTIQVTQTAPEIILRRADLGLQFVFVADVGKKMLALPVVRK